MLKTVRRFSICVLLGLAGCVPTAKPVPRWAIHVPPPTVDPAASVEKLRQRLIAEAGSAKITAQFLPPEQLAGLAIGEIRAGRGWDAVMLLAMASYRYHQTAIFAWQEPTHPPAHIRVDRNAFTKYLENEMLTFNRLDFDDEIEYIAAVLKRDEKQIEMYHNAFWEISQTAATEQKNRSRELLTQIEDAYHAPPENIRFKDVSHAFYQRLRNDVDSEISSYLAIHYLAITPLSTYLDAAFELTNRPFYVPMCRAIAPRLKHYRPQLVAALESLSQMTRSNAAVILGLRPSSEHLAILENHFSVQSHPAVRLSFAFALAKHDKDEYLMPIVQGVKDCHTEESTCDHAIHLLQWLPDEMKQRIPIQHLRAVLRDKNNTSFSRYFAAVILGDIARIQKLNKKSVELLLGTTRDEEGQSQLAEQAVEVVASLEQLTAKRIFRWISSHPGHRAVLLYRLAQISSEKEMSFYHREYPLFSQRNLEEKQAMVLGVGNIKGNSARDWLLRCYRQQPEFRFMVASLLAGRSDVPRSEYEALADLEKSAASVLLLFKINSPDGVRLARGLLQTGNPDDRAKTAIAVSLFQRTELAADLWRVAAYSDARYYPDDAKIRHTALEALIRLELSRTENLSGENWTGIQQQ